MGGVLGLKLWRNLSWEEWKLANFKKGRGQKWVFAC